MTREEIIQKMISRQRCISQREAASIIGVAPSRISEMIKNGKLEADKSQKPAKPILEAVLKYKPNPNMKRKKKI